MTIRDYSRIFRGRWRIVLTGLLLGIAAAFASVTLLPREYAADATMFVSGVADDASSALDSSQVSTQRMATYAELLESGKILGEVGAQLRPPLSGGDLAGRVTARALPETVLLEVTVRDPSAARSAEIANLLAARFIENVAELERYPDNFSQQVITARVFESAVAPQQPASPGLAFTLGLGALLGIVLGAGGALWRNAADSTIRSTEALRAIVDARVLGVVDTSVDLLREPRPARDPSPAHESVRRLRTNLQFAELETGRRAILVTGAGPDEATTTMLINLAVSTAAGGSRVLLVDADLRRASITERLGLESRPGLTEVLSTGQSWPELALRWVNGEVFVLPSGAPPPVGEELLLRPRMAELIDDARCSYDLVIVAAPPLGPSVDAATMAPHLDGVLLAVHRGTATRQRVATAVEMLQDVSARIAGVVMTERDSEAHRRPDPHAFRPSEGNAPDQDPASSPSPPLRPSPRPRADRGDGNGHAGAAIASMR